MADSQVQEVKDRIDIVDLITQYLPLKRSGTNFKGLCPFHRERSPSFMVHPERQSFKCFGCGEAGDVITFLQKAEGLTFPEALRLLADRANIELRPQTMAEQRDKDEKTQLYRLNAATAAFFHHILTATDAGAPARSYLAGRKVAPATIDTFQIGFAPAAGGLGPWLAKQGFRPADLNLAGHPERFRSRVMFPIRDPLGHVLGFTGRLIDDVPDAPKYLNTPETPIFKKSKAVYGLYEGKDAIRQYQVAILLEGQMDVVLSHQVGVRLAVASSGTALTADHLKAVRRYAPKLLLAFDADAAGQTAAEKAVALAAAAELSVKVVTMPDGLKDAGEAIERDPKLWQQAIGAARPAMRWLIDSMCARFGTADGTAKKLVARAVLPHIRAIVDPVEQAHAVGELARSLAVPEQAILDALARSPAPAAAAGQTAAPPIPAPAEPRPIVERLLGLLLVRPGLLSANEPSAAQLPAGSFAARLSKTMAACYTGPTQTAADFLTSIHRQSSREDQLAVTALVADTEHWIAEGIDPTAVAGELADRLRSGEREELKRSMAARIAAAEATGDRTQVKTLMTELQAMLKPHDAKA